MGAPWNAVFKRDEAVRPVGAGQSHGVLDGLSPGVHHSVSWELAGVAALGVRPGEHNSRKR